MLGITGAIFVACVIFAILFIRMGSAWFTLLSVVAALTILVYGVREISNSQTPPSQDSPISAMVSFYYEVLTSAKGFENYGKGYQVLAPTVTRRSPATSVAELGETWSGIAKTLELKVKESIEEEATCSVCSKKGKGIRTSKWGDLWTVEDSKLLMDSRSDFIFCPNCKTVYCVNCYIKLSGNRLCTKCQSQLFKKPLDILLTNPSHTHTKFEIENSSKWTGISNKSFRDGQETQDIDSAKATNVEDVVVTVKGLISYSTSWSREVNKTPPEINPLGAVFHNVAVKIGEKWYLMSATPGEFSDAS